MRYNLIFLFLVFTFRLSAQQKGETLLEVYVSHSSDTLPYQLHISSGMDTVQKYPLILWLNGKGERGADNEKQIHWIKNWLFDSLELSNYTSFVLSPQCIDLIDGDDSPWELSPLTSLANRGELVAYEHKYFWQAMDTLREKVMLEELWQSGKAPWKCWK